MRSPISNRGRGAGRAARIATAAAWLALAAGAPGSARAQEMALPLEDQVPMFLKALAYDRNLDEKARGDILIGLLYRPSTVASEAAARNAAKLIAACPMKAIGELPVFYRMIPYKDPDDLRRVIREEWVDVLYLAPGLSSLVDSVLTISAEAKVLTVTGVSEYVAAGVTLGLSRREGQPEMIVNLGTAVNEGTRFEGHFLNLCTVIRAEAEPRGSIAP